MDHSLYNFPHDASYETPMYSFNHYDPNATTVQGLHFSSPSQGPCAESSLDFGYGAMYPFSMPLFADLAQYSGPEGTPAAINPQELHTSAYPGLHVEDALSDCAPPTPELVSTPPQAPTSPTPVTSPESYETFHVPAAPMPSPSEAYPMKKDRQKGSANLLRSARDPDRQHQCTMCIRKFKRRADLARHIKRHQGLRPYACVATCCPLAPSDRHFFRADARQRHWKAHPQCEAEFYMTEAGIEWMKKNKNRSQKTRHRRLTSRDTSMDSYSGQEYDDDDDDPDYHD